MPFFPLSISSRSVAQYALDFHIASAESGWDQRALQGAFFHGLSENIKDELAARDESSNLGSLISLAIHLDNRLRERDAGRGCRHSVLPYPPLIQPLCHMSLTLFLPPLPPRRNTCRTVACAWN